MLENAQLLRKTSNSTKRVVYTASKASWNKLPLLPQIISICTTRGTIWSST
jgi:PIN domain nuclease of toxin-antitoxin system